MTEKNLLVSISPDNTLPQRVEDRIRALAASTTSEGGTLPVHSHEASDITDGILSPSRLGTGPATDQHYLRGDSAWTIPEYQDLPDLALKFENGLI